MQAYAEGFDILLNARSTDLPEPHRYELPLRDIAEVWRRGSVVSSWLLDLTAQALVESPMLSGYTGTRPGLGRRALDGHGRDRGERARGRALRVPVRPIPLAPGAHLRRAGPVRDAAQVRRARRASRREARDQWTASAGQGSHALSGAGPSRAAVRGGHLRVRRRPDEAEARPRALQSKGGRASAAGVRDRRHGAAGEDARAVPRGDDARTSGSSRPRRWTTRCGPSSGSALYFQAGELSDPAAYTQLADLLAGIAKRHGTGGNVLFYLAVPPSLFGEVARRLGEAGLVQAGRRQLAARDRREAVRSRSRLGPRLERGAGARSSGRIRSTGSITTSGRRPSRTSWCSGS